MKREKPKMDNVVVLERPALGTSPAVLADHDRAPTLVVRRGRGRVGGSTLLDLWIQRARHQGRRIKPLDGDLRSRTLSSRYPAAGPNGLPVLDGSSSPASDKLEDVRLWLLAEFDAMITDGSSRALDLGGGEQVMQAVVQDLDLASYCRGYGVNLVSAFFLGPDTEDFNHVIEIARSGDLAAERVMLVLNEGVIRVGQTVEGAFDRILSSAAFSELNDRGARSVHMRRLSCMDRVHDTGLGFYKVAEGKLDPDGRRISPTLAFMTKLWLDNHEEEHRKAETLEWLP